MEVGLIGTIGVHVSVITALEQEHGTELDLVPTLPHLVMEGYKIQNIVHFSFFAITIPM